MELTRIKRAVAKAGVELQGAVRDAEWQKQGQDSEEEQEQPNVLVTRLQAAVQLVGELTRDIVKMERNPPPPAQQPRKSNRWQVTT